MQIKDYEIVTHSVTGHIAIFITDLSSRRLHYHSDFELGLVLEGAVEITLGDSHFTFTKGEIYCINRFQLHSIKGLKDKNLILALQMRSSLYSHINNDLSRLHVKSAIRTDDPIHKNLHELILSCSKSFFYSEDVYELKCTYSLLNCLYILARDESSFFVSGSDERSFSHSSARLNRIIEYIENNYTHQLRLTDIAEAENLSPYYLSHFIKDSMGFTFQDYVNRLRFEHAFLLLTTTSYSLLDICMETGFSNTRYLHDAFKKNLGCNANEIRSIQDMQKTKVRNILNDKELILPTNLSRKYVDDYSPIVFSS